MMISLSESKIFTLTFIENIGRVYSSYVLKSQRKYFYNYTSTKINFVLYWNN